MLECMKVTMEVKEKQSLEAHKNHVKEVSHPGTLQWSLTCTINALSRQQSMKRLPRSMILLLTLLPSFFGSRKKIDVNNVYAKKSLDIMSSMTTLSPLKATKAILIIKFEFLHPSKEDRRLLSHRWHYSEFLFLNISILFHIRTRRRTSTLMENEENVSHLMSFSLFLQR